MKFITPSHIIEVVMHDIDVVRNALDEACNLLLERHEIQC